jgi:hypothetical protein
VVDAHDGIFVGVDESEELLRLTAVLHAQVARITVFALLGKSRSMQVVPKDHGRTFELAEDR